MKHHSYISSSRELIFTDRLGEFILRLIVFLALVFAVDRVLMLLKPPQTSVFAEAAAQKSPQVRKYLAVGTRADTVFIGSSQAQFAFRPDVFDALSRGKSYNAGIGGVIQTNRHFHLIEQFLEGEQPKRIVYHLDNWSLNQVPRPDDTGELITSFKSMQIMRGGVHNAIMAMARGGWRIPAFKPSNLDLSAFKSYEGYKLHDNGWVEGFGIADPKVVRTKGIVFDPNPASVVWLQKIVDLCRDAAVELVLIQTPLHPTYRETNKNRLEAFTNWMNIFAAEKGLRFHDFSAAYDNGSLFFDTNHLNSEGAKHFTMQLAQHLN